MAATRLDKIELKRRAVRILPSILFTLLFISGVYLWQYYSPNRGDAKLKELQQISSETPVHPAFISVSTRTNSRASDAGVYKNYASMATFDEVKGFYKNALAQRGWTLKQPATQAADSEIVSEIVFVKGEYSIAIEYHGQRPGDRVADYSMNFLWRDR
jgi:hypothetical protein